MKKLIALLVAMMMAFSCVSVLAEETAISINVPSFTLTSEVSVNEEQVMALLPVQAATSSARSSPVIRSILTAFSASDTTE